MSLKESGIKKTIMANRSFYIRLIGIVILTAFMWLVFIGMAGCRTAKNVTSKIEKTLEKKDSSHFVNSDSINVKKDSSHYSTVIVVDYDSGKYDPDHGWAWLDGSTYTMPDPVKKNKEITLKIGNAFIHSTQPVKSITIKSDGGFLSIDSTIVRKKDSIQYKDEAQTTTKDLYKTVKRMPFSFFAVCGILFLILILFLYLKYKSKIQSFLKL